MRGGQITPHAFAQPPRTAVGCVVGEACPKPAVRASWSGTSEDRSCSWPFTPRVLAVRSSRGLAGPIDFGWKSAIALLFGQSRGLCGGAGAYKCDDGGDDGSQRIRQVAQIHRRRQNTTWDQGLPLETEASPCAGGLHFTRNEHCC
jgi:hypothetical protein